MEHSVNLTSGTQRRKAWARVLLVVLLLVGMVIVAVQAKTPHYSPKNLQSRYFTASVKIADRVYHHSQQMHRLAVFPTPLKLPELGKSQFAFSVEREAGRVRPSVDIPQLRSPPIAL
jgi:hypothetical protein